MAPWTVQLITLLGVAVGALASFVSTSLTDRRRWKQEVAVRLNSERRECYSQFARTIQRFIDIAFHTAAGFGLPADDVPPLDSETGLEGLPTARAELNVQMQQVVMIGNRKVIEAAVDYQRQAWLLEEFARGRFSDPDEFRKATYDRRKARQRFYSEARADLGVASGEITTPSRT